MKPEEIKLNDWTRILFGEVPPSFYLELIIRAILVYLLLTISMRLLGKRMSNQLSSLELAAMVALASAIGVPMLTPDRGILPAYLIAFVVVGVTKLISTLGYKNEPFEHVAQGKIDLLVEDSVMNYKTMQKVRVSRERLFAELRSENVNHLGELKRLYMEPNGTFTLIKNEDEKAGLPVLPDNDQDFIREKLQYTDVIICGNCGAEKPKSLQRLNGNGKCLNCGHKQWTKAVTEKS